MNVKSVAAHILAELEEIGSEERRKKTTNYAPTSQRVVGVTNPEMRGLIRELKKENASWHPGEWIGLCKELVSMSVFECQVVAFEIIAGSKKHRDSMSKSVLREVEHKLQHGTKN